MRELSASLLEAQLSPSREGVVSVVFRKKRPGWQTLYTGSEDDYHHAAAFAGDGSMIRARLTLPGDSRKLYRQRIASPDESSDFSQWTYTGEYNAVAVAACALGAEISILWIKTDRSLRRIKSTDYGVTFGAPELIDYSPTTACGGLAAAYKPNGDLAVFFADQSTLYVKKRISGAWQARMAWNKSTGALTGVSCVYDGDWSLVITGQDAAGNYRLWSLIYGDGGSLPAGTWGELNEIAASPSAEGYDFRQAFLDKDEVYHCAYVEKFTGAEAYSRVYLTSTVPGAAFDAGLWTEPEPLDVTGDYGVSILHSADAMWLSSANSVRRALIDNADTDVTPNVVAVRLALGESEGTVAIELDIADWAIPAIDIGDEVAVSPGYVTDGGIETSEGLSFIAGRIERVSSPGKSSLIVEAADGWAAVKAWKAKNQLRWNASTPSHSIESILGWLLGRVGLRLAVISASEAVTPLCPDFSLPPGTDGLSAINRLLSMVPDCLFIEGGTAYLKNPLSDEATAYAYGLEHQINACRVANVSPEVNHLRLAGAGGLAVDAYDWTSLAGIGELYRHASDGGLSSITSLRDLADTLLREAQMPAAACEITVPVNCGQQLYDAVEVTDEDGGIAKAYRVAGIAIDYRPNKGKYEMKLRLGGV